MIYRARMPGVRFRAWRSSSPGDPNQYFYPGDRHEHPAWDSLCFDYGKDEVIHFLLSNCKYWLNEFHFDGFRFDGVTSMLYYSHGLGEAFCNYGDYFNGHEDDNAICLSFSRWQTNRFSICKHDGITKQCTHQH